MTAGGPPRLVYVCSAARCGSTVLDMFLGGHPSVASLGELNFLGKALRLGQACTCGAEVRACPAWSQVMADVADRTRHDLRADPYALRLWDARATVQVDRAHQSPGYERSLRLRKAWLALRASLPEPLKPAAPLPPVLSTALRNKWTLVESLARSWQVPVLVDSSKNPWEAVELARQHPRRVMVVLLTRDGRGVYHSRRRSGFSREQSVEGWRGYYRQAIPLLESHLQPDQWVRLRYEDFAARPEETGRRLCQALHLDYVPEMTELSRAQRHMVNGNDTRFRPERGIHLDERWRTDLDAEELAYFVRAAGGLNTRLGYV